MSSVFFQGRGNVYLQIINANGSLGAARKLCTDALSIAMSSNRWSHINKCGTVDVEDASGTNSNSASLTMKFADMGDKNFALGVLGLVEPQGSPGTVVSETLPGDLANDDVWFLGGKTRHRNITGLTISGMTVNVDYTLDAPSGKVTFIGDQSASPAPTAAYGYTDPQHVALFNAPVYNYLLSFEFLNKQQANAEGGLELYKVRFDPADNVDMQSDGEQSMNLKGSALADIDRAADSELGQFGRRVLTNALA